MNTNNMTQTVSIVDTTPPYFYRDDRGLPPAATTMECRPEGAATRGVVGGVLHPAELLDPYSIKAGDACSDLEEMLQPAPTIQFHSNLTGSSCKYTYNLTRTWTATDTWGQDASLVQTVFVVDEVAPFAQEQMPSCIPGRANATATYTRFASASTSLLDHVSDTCSGAGEITPAVNSCNVTKMLSSSGAEVDVSTLNLTAGSQWVQLNGSDWCTYVTSTDSLLVKGALPEGVEELQYYVSMSLTDACANTRNYGKIIRVKRTSYGAAGKAVYSPARAVGHCRTWGPYEYIA